MWVIGERSVDDVASYPATTVMAVIYLVSIGQLTHICVFINEASDGAEILADPNVH